MNRRNESITLLMCDDDKDDCMLTRDALEESRLLNTLNFVHDGEQLLDYLHQRNEFTDVRQSPKPDLILLDLNMPKKDGREALQEIRATAQFKHIPVVILTTSQAEEDILKSYRLGASAFITKPVTFDGLVKVLKSIGHFWFEIVELPREK